MIEDHILHVIKLWVSLSCGTCYLFQSTPTTLCLCSKKELKTFLFSENYTTLFACKFSLVFFHVFVVYLILLCFEHCDHLQWHYIYKSLLYMYVWFAHQALVTWLMQCAYIRAVASLTVPGGHELHFPNFFLKFRSVLLIFPQTLLIFFLILVLRVGDSPTWEGPGYATGLHICISVNKGRVWKALSSREILPQDMLYLWPQKQIILWLQTGHV